MVQKFVYGFTYGDSQREILKRFAALNKGSNFPEIDQTVFMTTYGFSEQFNVLLCLSQIAH